jgi:DNA-binding MarR family transcriptional regulator
MHPTTLNRDLKPLRAQGLVADAADASDRRARALVITGKGRARLRKAIPFWRHAQARLEGALGAELARALTDVLDSASTKLQSKGPP